MKYTKDILGKNREKVVIENPRAPYHRCYRPFVERSSSWDSLRNCLDDDGYAVRPYSYTKAFLSLQKEMEELFTFVEASYNNRNTYSYRIQQLLIRVCIELEANFKAIMSENKYSKDSNWWDINDYWKINTSHKLSEYKVYMPNWEGDNKYFEPFAGWRKSPRLAWYRAFQHTKHNRDGNLYEANLENLMNAFCGLFVVLSAQFGNEDYVTGPTLISVSSRDSYYGCDFGIGNMLKAEYPEWSEEEKYDIDWAEVCESPERFRRFDYDAIPDYKNKSLVHSLSCSEDLMVAIRKQGFEKRYKACEKFNQMFLEGILGDDNEAVLEFHDVFEETDPSLGSGEIRQVKRCVNAMEIALDEIDEYEPEVFFEIANRIAAVIVEKK